MNSNPKEGKSRQEHYAEEHQRRKEFLEKQNTLFHSVLAHLNEQVKNQIDKMFPDEYKKILVIYTGSLTSFILIFSFSKAVQSVW